MKKMENITKIVQSLEDSGLLVEGVTQTIKNETKKQRGGFFSMFLGTLVASLLGNMSAAKGFIQPGDGAMSLKEIGIIRACEGCNKFRINCFHHLAITFSKTHCRFYTESG